MLLKVKPSLKTLREANGYTQAQFSQLLHIHQTTYSKLECGDAGLQPDLAYKISTVLQVAVDDFAEISGTLYHITGNNFTQSSITGIVNNQTDEELKLKIIELTGLLVPLCKQLIKNQNSPKNQ